MILPWSRARDALAGIVALDEDLEKNLLKGLDNQECRRFKLDMLGSQVKYQGNIFPDVTAAAGAGRHWMDFIDLIAAQNGHKLVNDIK